MNLISNLSPRRALPAILLAAATARAALPEPDNLLYGSISLDNVPVAAARADVAVEARRTLGGPAISRYRMGSDASLGSFYSLSIILDSGSGPARENASATGDSLFIVVTDASGVRAQASYTVGTRGEVLRLDFGTAVIDADGNGLADLWEVEHFGATHQDPAALAANGRTLLDNYIAGTDPNSGSDFFQVAATLDAGQRHVSFIARAAAGPGYSGRARFYTLETAADLKSGPWVIVPGYANIRGNNQTVTFSQPLAAPNAFFRGKVRLQQE
jgi:hypothetical protein